METSPSAFLDSEESPGRSRLIDNLEGLPVGTEGSTRREWLGLPPGRGPGSGRKHPQVHGLVAEGSIDDDSKLKGVSISIGRKASPHPPAALVGADSGPESGRRQARGGTPQSR